MNVRQFSIVQKLLMNVLSRSTEQQIPDKFILKQLRGLKVKNSYRIRWDSCTLSEGQCYSYSPLLLHFLWTCHWVPDLLPDDWKKARVSVPLYPLYKSGGRKSMDNCRQISILPVLSKVMEKAVNFQVQQYLKTWHSESNSIKIQTTPFNWKCGNLLHLWDQKKCVCWKINWCLICRS